ncbi:MAG TPA: DoxX family protein [Cytophagales bacterium]|jgi:hypothetical protein
MKKITLIYRISTGLVAVLMGLSGMAYLLRLEHFAASTRELGYPVYLMSMLGVAKLLGIAALLAPKFDRVKEWAYAGFTFNLLGAAWSHAAIGQYDHALLALLWLGVLLTSYLSFRKLRHLQGSPSPRTAPPPPAAVARA